MKKINFLFTSVCWFAACTLSMKSLAQATQSLDQTVNSVLDDQNPTNYIIYAVKEASFGRYNYISGDVGVTATNGKAGFKRYNILDSFKVKAAEVHVQIPSTVNNIFMVPATGGPSPAFYPYSGNTSGLSNIDVTVNNTVLNGGWKNVKVKKGITATITGNNFGKITIEEGAHVTFTAQVINLEELKVEKGKKHVNFTIVNFRNPAAVKVKDKVTVEAYTRVNVGGPKVTFYAGDNSGDEEKFEVKGEDNQVTANIMIPNGILKVDGGSYNAWPTVMTGWYIIEKLAANCKFVYWNRDNSSIVNPPS